MSRKEGRSTRRGHVQHVSAKKFYEMTLAITSGRLHLGARLRAYRTMRGISQADVAYELDCTDMTVSNIERGRAPVDDIRAAKYRRAVDRAVRWHRSQERPKRAA